MTTVVLSSVDARHAGTAARVLHAARQVGGAIGVAVFGALATGGPNRIIKLASTLGKLAHRRKILPRAIGDIPTTFGDITGLTSRVDR